MNEKNAYDFKLKNQDGKEVSLKYYAGKWLVIYFYPKDSTPGCTNEACDFTDGLADFQNLGCHVIGISADSIESHKKFINKYNLKIELLSDPDRSVIKAYGAWGEKVMYGKKTEGVIRSTFLISPEGKIAEKWSGVKVREKKASGEVKHSDVVKQKLSELTDKA